MTEGRMPRKVYTIGDTIRLRVEFTSYANIEDVQATYFRDDAPPTGSSSPLGSISFEGTVEESRVLAEQPYHLPSKRFSATLVCLVDRDHAPGSYALGHLILRSAGGFPLYQDPESTGGIVADSFRIQEEVLVSVW